LAKKGETIVADIAAEMALMEEGKESEELPFLGFA